MTIQEFIEKFPLAKAKCEDSNLLDMACPECGYRAQFEIAATAFFEVEDEGTIDYQDVLWGEGCKCKCCGCGHYATVKDFTIEGLDEALDEQEQNRLYTTEYDENA
jgi:hypothetical protein